MIHKFLDNGIEYLIQKNAFTDIVCVQCWVKVGSINENKNQRGMSHLIEHMLFKGTKKRKVGEIAKIIEHCGGDINAYTSFDKTVYHLSINPEYVETAIDILADAIFYSTFDTNELNKEKEVICEEIRKYRDDPYSMITEKTFSYAFCGTEAARPIIGYEKDIKKFSKTEILKFYNMWYRPDNISVVVLGNIDIEQTEILINKYFGKISKPKFNKNILTQKLIQRQFPKGITTHVIKGDFKKSKLQISFKAPHFENLEAIALDLAMFSFGGAQSSRLVRNIQDSLQLVSEIDASLYAPKFGGITIIHSTPLEDKILQTIEAIASEIINFKYYNPLTLQELQTAKQNYKSSYFFQKEQITKQASKLGFSLQTIYKYVYEEISMLALNKLQLSTIHNIIQKWLDENNVIIIALVPKNYKITSKYLKMAYLKSIQKTKNKVLSQKTKQQHNIIITKSTLTDNNTNEPQIIKIKDGITAVYKPNINSEVFCLVAVSEGGLRSENKEIAGINHAVSLMLGKGTISKTYTQLLDIIEGSGASIEGFSGKDSLGLKLECLKEQIDVFIPLFFECLKTPHFYDDPWNAIHKDILETIRSQEDLPAKIGFRKFGELLFNTHPYSLPIYGLKDSVIKFNTQNILDYFNQYKNKGPWVLGCVGPKENQKIIELIKKCCENWNPLNQKRTFNNTILYNNSIKKEHIFKDREQTHIVLGNIGLNWFSPQRYATDILINILDGQGGRLFINLRDKKSLAYTVTAFCTYAYNNGALGAYIACAPNKVEESINTLINEFKNLYLHPPKDKEIERAKNYIIGTHNLSFQTSESQAMSMALMELYGIGYRDFMEYAQKIKNVSNSEIYEQAKNLLNLDNIVIITVGPNQ